MGYSEHIAALKALALRVPAAQVAAVKAAQEPIVTDARELVTKDTGILESTIVQLPPEVQGPIVIGTVNAGSTETLSGWPGNRKRIREHHGAGGSVGVGPIWSDVGREIFQEFGTSTNTPAVHYLEDATVNAMSGMLQREGAAFSEAL